MAGEKFDLLKLMALDTEDLQIISAHLQDSVLRVGDLKYLATEKRFAIILNRFVWDKAMTKRGQIANQRRRTALHFERVEKVQSLNIRQDAPDGVLNLLAIQFLPTHAPAGTIDLTFSGNGTVRLFVECIEAQFADLGSAWQAVSRPHHTFDDQP